MVVHDLSILKGKRIKIATMTYQGSEGLYDDGIVTGVIASGHDTIFVELDSKTLINAKYVRRIEILD